MSFQTMILVNISIHATTCFNLVPVFLRKDMGVIILSLKMTGLEFGKVDGIWKRGLNIFKKSLRSTGYQYNKNCGNLRGQEV